MTLDVDLPLGRLIALTGVSGSGKSTLARDVLRHECGAQCCSETRAMRRTRGCRRDHRLRAGRARARGGPDAHRQDAALLPATYVGFWDAIRRVFAGTTEAGIRGYTASRFSFNTAGGRCASLRGPGRTHHRDELPAGREDVRATRARGQRFDPETLSIRWRGTFHRRRAGHERGRGRGVLPQPSLDPSSADAAAGGGPGLSHAGTAESDALGRRGAAHQAGHRAGTHPRADAAMPAARGTLYVLDEPTVGLHMADVEKLHRCAAPADRCRQHRAGHRAQPRCDRPGGLGDRPRTRSRTRRAGASSPPARRHGSPASRAHAPARHWPRFLEHRHGA